MPVNERLLELASRCEAATADEQASLLREAFEAIHGPKPARVLGGSDELTEWLARFNPFYALLQAKGSLDAAMTLVPQGWRKRMLDSDHWRCICELACDEDDREVGVQAATWPLALCAAALKARANRETGNAG